MEDNYIEAIILLQLVQKRRCLKRNDNERLIKKINDFIKKIDPNADLDMIGLYQEFTGEKVEPNSWLHKELTDQEQ